MSSTGSFSAQHYGGPDVSGAIVRVQELLERASGNEQLTEIQLLSCDLIRDAARLSAAVPHLISAHDKDARISAESIEVITRKVLEHAILLEYLLHHKDEEQIVRVFLERCRAAYSKSFERPHVSPKNLSSWPNYEQMARSYPALYEVYRRLSYLAHPKTCIPYSFMERSSGVSPAEYLKGRAEHSEVDLATILHIATDSAWVILDMV